ncbi:sensor histidine kinase [Microbispora triticiradicis]|uniref:histidine kinase n=3 Tax=Microbispora TaxID=2005 RepID=A0ABY3LVR0_9ACTN|nr:MULTISPECIES: sensor histidine kinase [Microbispora]RGA03678.1 sensor histidine kinase [Microbispora triticiradicis]TLP59559.1 sensor histidine kinase [Microbispora fusca]TYB56691.1 sensor histidine kinase [Microbispora tritici]GLW22971.1 histidine kinase [Microbispora amethystogenes]
MTTPWDRIRGHWSSPTWLRTIHVTAGVPIALTSAAAISGLVALSIALAWTVVVPLVSLLVLTWIVPRLTRLQRSRFAAFLGHGIPEVTRLPRDGSPIRRLLLQARSGVLWRQVAYHLAIGPVIGAAGFLSGAVAWSACLVAAIVAVRLLMVGGGWTASLPAAGALSLFVVVPWLLRGITALDAVAARALLGPSVKDELARRVETLRESRAELAEAADAERRRIERDLHDGTQQRLVSLALNLGMARAAFTDLPEPARQAIARSHEEAKQALKDLRDVVRGLHPAVLDHQGLDAALSGLAARAPFPVRLSVDVPERVAPVVEAIAFFVVSEALTNVAKHARASGADVTVRRDAGVLRVVVRDDGHGGAEPTRGSGLRGLAQRAGSVDGTLRVDSPSGGPTTIEVELPCA